MAKNSFAVKLQELLHSTNTKNSTLAKAVQYDLSYISKWLSGKMLPSEKNVEEVIERITVCLLEGDTQKLKEEYQCTDLQLGRRITEDLKAAYDKCRSSMAADHIQASKSMGEVIASIDRRIQEGSSVAAMVDLLSLPHESRLVLAGIKDGHFSYGVQNIDYSMVISLDAADCVYDAIFLIHMLTSFSGRNFKLYNNPVARGKFIYNIDETAVAAFLFPGNKNLISVAEYGADKKIRQSIEPFLAQENLIFAKTSIREMIAQREYVRSMISANVRWVLGHATELLLPEDVFEQLAAGRPEEEEFRKMYRMSQNVVDNPQTRILIYETAVANLTVDCEVDFYNEKVKLTPGQLLRCLDYYLEQVDRGAQIKMVDGGFSKDFRYITNPCMFLSDSVGYLRLKNDRYENNIMLINDWEGRSLFEKFYDTVWTQRKDVVIEDKDQIRRKIQHYRHSAEILNHT